MRIRRLAFPVASTLLLALLTTGPAGSAQCAGAGLSPTHRVSEAGATIAVRGSGMAACDDTTGPFLSCVHHQSLRIQEVTLRLERVPSGGASPDPATWDIGTFQVSDGGFSGTVEIPDVAPGDYRVVATTHPDEISVRPMRLKVPN